MKTSILLIISVLASFAISAQAESPKQFHIEYKLYNIRWKNDSASVIKDAVVKADFSKISEVLPLYKSGKIQYGIQFEVNESHLNNETRYFLSIAYYYRTDSKWVLTNMNDGMQLITPAKADTDIYDDSSTDYVWTPDFGVRYRCSIAIK